MLKDKRVGRFTIHLSMIDKHPEVVHAIMKGLIILRAEALGYANVIEYIAVGVPFDETTDSCRPPEYTPQIYQNEDGSARFEGWVRNSPERDANIVWTSDATCIDLSDLFRNIDTALNMLSAINTVTGVKNGNRAQILRKELRQVAEAKGINMN